ncbi:hypothetical protein [Desulfuribacillus alkaliarsenatis]|uniref:Uncharacterized protein n=1 Tax=Desulfuribacillus alkaliarsenatis TaxID=766136 RepID=A0A1E5G011_9FIRM|nr:hypothetical protein [Desulfuribacillus alkaliarsenatis]OEF96120.1 hypothetical protein BHF68_10335 [Desulfuribacillus alkaliarsenatis]
MSSNTFVFLLLLILVLLTGCSLLNITESNTLVFTHESENWKVLYIEKVSEPINKNQPGKQISSKVEIRYLGNHIEDIYKIKYSYKSSAGSGSSETTLSESGIISSGIVTSSGTSTPEDGIVNFTIEWNGQIEEFEFKSDKSIVFVF